jgi:hypothetical protein
VWLEQRPVTNVSEGTEDNASQATAGSVYTLLAAPDAPLTSRTEVIDGAGALYEVEGVPAVRRGITGRPRFLAALLVARSDLAGRR